MKFYQITDLHYYPAKLLNAQGKEWINRAMYDQKCIAESEAILDATIQMLLDDKEIDIVLITGDNVCDGERVGIFRLPRNCISLPRQEKRSILSQVLTTCTLSRRAIQMKRANMLLKVARDRNLKRFTAILALTMQ